ncbi:FxSxx-COOH cyclophane-containing RiPP peptide [Streptomyces bauhiniae]|uniref:FXSXX-COOH protein n=1 Tax=Streptomyces bauhiniae TaxID=2340725 RepID=A0A7K3QNR6_9ACTN|nr:FxSxx-COOH cyclophane-containing RiPP peptide [Streptomyces bauhiniae]NEB91547.1 FXSXX-COOH protein [Streptomyces bauhiniae]
MTSAGDESPVPEHDEPLPDLLALDLEDLRTLDHPVLREVLDTLTERARKPAEMLWGFNNCL